MGQKFDLVDDGVRSLFKFVSTSRKSRGMAISGSQVTSKSMKTWVINPRPDPVLYSYAVPIVPAIIATDSIQPIYGDISVISEVWLSNSYHDSPFDGLL